MLIECIQEICTTGARAVETFRHGGVRYLAIAQLARDVPGQSAHMSVGNSDVETSILRWHEGVFVSHETLAVSGGEDAEFFTIDGRGFLATASIREGSGPYRFNIFSTIWEMVNGHFIEFQKVPTFAAKQWRYFNIGRRHFLALAQGAPVPGVVPEHSSASMILEWNGSVFEPLQQIDSAIGYNWLPFTVDGEIFLAYADHIVTSCVLRWNGDRFVHFQDIESGSGRAFSVFQSGNQTWLAFARLYEECLLYRWNGDKFERHQTLGQPGGREMKWVVDANGQGRLFRVNFLRGSRDEPETALASLVYEHSEGMLLESASFATTGGTDLTSFTEAGVTYIVVANSLSPAVRFAAVSRVYRLEAHA